MWCYLWWIVLWEGLLNVTQSFFDTRFYININVWQCAYCVKLICWQCTIHRTVECRCIGRKIHWLLACTKINLESFEGCTVAILHIKYWVRCMNSSKLLFEIGLWKPSKWYQDGKNLIHFFCYSVKNVNLFCTLQSL